MKQYLDTQCIDQKAIDNGYMAGIKNADNKLSGTCDAKTMLGGVCKPIRD
jgi:hypothetical protein